MALIPGNCHLNITDTLQSRPYVHMTRQALEHFSIDTNDLTISADSKFRTPKELFVEGDWSNAAFWLAANALGSDLDIQNLNIQSAQGDRAMIDHLTALHDFALIDATHAPDLVPILAITAGAKKGAKFVGCARLRLKETDRLATTAAMINNLGGRAVIEGDDLIVDGTGYRGGIVDALNDHRIAMSAAIAATLCQERVTILNAHEVKKSYPSFWEDYQKLGGNYELYLR
jgi:3-phosphoshikimate 1-carboxyvinyltransferase